MVRFIYCPQCGILLQKTDSYPYCQQCNLYLYRNSKPTVGIIIIKNGKILVSRRAFDPHKGMIDTIGGFLEAGEEPIDGAIREVREETGLEIEIVDFLGTYVDGYEYGGDKEFTLNIYFIAKIKSGVPKASDDVAEVIWIPIGKIPEDAAFKNTRLALTDAAKWYKLNSHRL